MRYIFEKFRDIKIRINYFSEICSDEYIAVELVLYRVLLSSQQFKI